jgi:hypothetical protein
MQALKNEPKYCYQLGVGFVGVSGQAPSVGIYMGVA